MKKTLVLGAVLIVLLTTLLFVLHPKQVGQLPVAAIPENSTSTNPQKEPVTTETPPQASTTMTHVGNNTKLPQGKLKVANFVGTLQSVNIGCFSDGECSVEVDGKHITTLLGWNNKIVGSVLGVEGFADLEAHVGEKVEVYVQDLSNGKFTLYGSEGFYIKVLKGTKTATSTVGSQSACVIGGCSSQLCVDASQGNTVSTCEYRESYACYKSATCERQVNGQCGWTQTPVLTQCLVGK